MEKIKKEKYLFYNDFNKVIVLRGKKGKLIFPSIITNGDDFKNVNEETYDIFSKYLTNKEFLDEYKVFELKTVRVQNNKLKKILFEKISTFYSCFYQFNSEDLDEIIKQMRVLNRYITIELLKPDELLELIDIKNIKSSSSNKEAIKILKKKLEKS